MQEYEIIFSFASKRLNKHARPIKHECSRAAIKVLYSNSRTQALSRKRERERVRQRKSVVVVPFDAMIYS